MKNRKISVFLCEFFRCFFFPLLTSSFPHSWRLFQESPLGDSGLKWIGIPLLHQGLQRVGSEIGTLRDFAVAEPFFQSVDLVGKIFRKKKKQRLLKASPSICSEGFALLQIFETRETRETSRRSVEAPTDGCPHESQNGSPRWPSQTVQTLQTLPAFLHRKISAKLQHLSDSRGREAKAKGHNLKAPQIFVASFRVRKKKNTILWRCPGAIRCPHREHVGNGCADKVLPSIVPALFVLFCTLILRFQDLDFADVDLQSSKFTMIKTPKHPSGPVDPQILLIINSVSSACRRVVDHLYHCKTSFARIFLHIYLHKSAYLI